MAAALLFVVCGLVSAQETETPAPGSSSAGTVMLNSGYEMPVFGVSCAMLPAERAESLAYEAVRAGFRLIMAGGTAGNEEGTGKGIRKAIDEKLVSREDLFLVLIYAEESETVEPGEVIKASLERMGLEYLDMMILRQNIFGRDVACWEAMEQAADDGMIRSLGLSGFSDMRNFDLFTDNAASVTPAVLMTAMHPYARQTDVREHLDAAGTLLVSEAPLGETGEEQVIFADQAVSVPASRLEKTSSQVILRWHLQSGNIFLPAVSDAEQIEEYADILDFVLSDEEMDQINALDRPARFN